MGNSVKRVLFVNSEIYPYLPENEMSRIGRNLPQGIQERKRKSVHSCRAMAASTRGRTSCTK